MCHKPSHAPQQNSYLVGAGTGMSAGFSPSRMRPTYPRGSPDRIKRVRSVRDQAAIDRTTAIRINWRQFIASGKTDYEFAMNCGAASRYDHATIARVSDTLPRCAPFRRCHAHWPEFVQHQGTVRPAAGLRSRREGSAMFTRSATAKSTRILQNRKVAHGRCVRRGASRSLRSMVRLPSRRGRHGVADDSCDLRIGGSATTAAPGSRIRLAKPGRQKR
jgi:hypothetical protein